MVTGTCQGLSHGIQVKVNNPIIALHEVSDRQFEVQFHLLLNFSAIPMCTNGS